MKIEEIAKKLEEFFQDKWKVAKDFGKYDLCFRVDLDGNLLYDSVYFNIISDRNELSVVRVSSKYLVKEVYPHANEEDLRNFRAPLNYIKTGTHPYLSLDIEKLQEKQLYYFGIDNRIHRIESNCIESRVYDVWSREPFSGTEKSAWQKFKPAVLYSYLDNGKLSGFLISINALSPRYDSIVEDFEANFRGEF